MAEKVSLAPRLFRSYLFFQESGENSKKITDEGPLYGQKRPAAAFGRRRPFLGIYTTLISDFLRVFTAFLKQKITPKHSGSQTGFFSPRQIDTLNFSPENLKVSICL